jgi:oxygen-dependent protoporphyrinogen oxidase
VQQTNDTHRRALVVRNGKLVPIPEGFELMAPRHLWAMARSPIFSPWGKLRMAMERFIPARRDNDDESLESFVVRRFGREALDRLVQPLIGGIYTGDPKTLSLRATVPRFLDMEAKHGSILKALRAAGKAPSSRHAAGAEMDTGARYSLFVSFKEGMGALPAALAGRLGDAVQLGRRAARIERGCDLHVEGRPAWRMTLADGGTLNADGIVLAIAAHAAAPLVQPFDGPLAASLHTIDFASSSIVVLAWRRDQVRHPLDAFGFVVPHIEGRKIIAGSFSHVKFAGRAPADCVLLRAFIGGALQPELAEVEDDELIRIARDELGQLLGITAAPLLVRVRRYPKAMPQYKVGHLRLIESIRDRVARHKGLELAGISYEGVGIPDVIQQAQLAAERLLAAI